jgi:hypothetical protein
MLRSPEFRSWCGQGSVDTAPYRVFCDIRCAAGVTVLQIQVFPYLSRQRESVDFYSGFLRLFKSGRSKIKEEE